MIACYAGPVLGLWGAPGEGGGGSQAPFGGVLQGALFGGGLG